MPSKLNIDEDSYRFFAKLQYDIYASKESNILLDFNPCNFIAPAFIAYLGALISLANKWEKKLELLSEQNKAIKNYFKHSGLYDYYSGTQSKSINKNSIPFTKVQPDDDMLIEYIDNILQLAPINLTDACRDSLFKNIYEIFCNAMEHSQSTCGIYTCGHWMPKRNQLIFSVCDTGIGIPRLVNQKITNITSLEAIKWALQRGHSTKQLTNGVPRGLGMADLKDFTKLNQGSLIVFSNDIYYNCSADETIINLPYDIIGTLITVVIIADYKHIYYLKEEYS